MSIRVGDTVFIKSGHAAIVKGRSTDTGQLELKVDTPEVQHDTRHGVINGMTPDARKELYEILDQVKEATSVPSERVDQMRDKILELEKDPRNFVLAKYLRAEMGHLINTHNIKPKEYSVYESKAR